MSEHECVYWDPSACAGTIHCPPRCPRFIDREGTPWVIRPAEADDRDELVAMYDDFAAVQRATRGCRRASVNGSKRGSTIWNRGGWSRSTCGGRRTIRDSPRFGSRRCSVATPRR